MQGYRGFYRSLQGAAVQPHVSGLPHVSGYTCVRGYRAGAMEALGE